MTEVENIFYWCGLTANFLAFVIGEDGCELATLATLIAIDSELGVELELVVGCLSCLS